MILGSDFLAWTSPVVTSVRFIEMPGFCLSQSVICSSRNCKAPGWSFVKNVFTPVIRSVETTLAAGLWATGLGIGGMGGLAAGTGAAAPPKFKGACDTLVFGAGPRSRGIGLSKSSRGMGLLRSPLEGVGRMGLGPAGLLRLRFSIDCPFCGNQVLPVRRYRDVSGRDG